MIEALGNLFSATVRLSTPVLFAALGESMSEKSGVLNIGLEGIMLMGAFAGFYGAYVSGSLWLGLLLAAVVGMLVSLVFAFATVTLHGDQIVIGVAVNLLALGVTSFLLRMLFGVTTTPSQIEPFSPIPIPFLADLPIVGPMLFHQTAPTYLAFLLVPLVWWLVYRSTFGLGIRSVGENPHAADAAGLSVEGLRYAAVVGGGALVGIGGAYLSTSQLGMFLEDMVAGRGFIALAAVILGRWHPAGILAGCLLFGFADALQLRLQVARVGIPYQFLLMLPYLVTVAVLAWGYRKVAVPRALAIPFERSQR